jgi:hypothetical protein
MIGKSSCVEKTRCPIDNPEPDIVALISAPPFAGPAPAIVRGARRATIRQPSRSARGTRRATIRRTGAGRRAGGARRATICRAGAGHRARCAARHHLPAHHRPPAVALGARRNTIRRLLALRADGLLLSKTRRDRFECLESTFDSCFGRSNVEQKYTY